MTQVERKVSVGAGSDKGHAAPLSFPDLTTLVDFLNGQRGDEVWWSGGTFEGGKRQTRHWAGSSLVVVDVDGPQEPDPEREGKTRKTALTEAAWEALREAFRGGRLPGHWMHRTPHGLRLVALLDRFVDDPDTWRDAALALAQMTDDALSLNQALAGLRLSVDAPTTMDRARLFWAPFSTVDGKPRNGVGITNSQRPFYVIDMLKAPQGGYVAGKPRTPTRGRRGTSAEWQAARLKYVAQNPLPQIGKERECPACGHRGCVNVFPQDDTRLWCWSSNHGEVGRPVGDPNDGSVRGWLFDALDLAAHVQGKSPTRILIDAGLLTPEAARGPDESLPEVLRAGPNPQPNGDYLDREAKDWAEEALSFMTERGTLYRRADKAQVVTEGTRLTSATDYDMQALAGDCVRSVEWVKPRKKGGDPEKRWRFHTRADGGTLREAASKSIHVPMVDVVVNYPVFAGKGFDVVPPGYHAESRILHLGDRRLKDLETYEVGEDLKSTTRALLLSLMEDFPFTSEADHENAIAAMFTMLIRPAVDTVPIFYVGAQKAGTGKTILCNTVVGMTVTGMDVGVTNIREGEEREKRISTAALHGDPLIIFDNLDADVEVAGASFASFVTAPYWNLRILGKSEKARVCNRAVVMANGNNNEFSDEVARRVWPIMLTTPSARPDTRTDFKHPNLREWVEQMRLPVLGAMLSSVEGWKRAGMPGPIGDTHSGFPEWHHAVGGIMGWLGFTKFGTNLSSFRDSTQGEEERDARALIEHWLERDNGPHEWHTLNEIYDWVRERQLFASVLHGQSNEANVFKMGVMRRIANQPFRTQLNGSTCDYMITRKRAARGSVLRLRKVGD